jgi:hypothetical protein
MTYIDFAEYPKNEESWSNPAHEPNLRYHTLINRKRKLGGIIDNLELELESTKQVIEQLELKEKYEQCQVWYNQICDELTNLQPE